MTITNTELEQKIDRISGLSVALKSPINTLFVYAEKLEIIDSIHNFSNTDDMNCTDKYVMQTLKVYLEATDKALFSIEDCIRRYRENKKQEFEE